MTYQEYIKQPYAQSVSQIQFNSDPKWQQYRNGAVGQFTPTGSAIAPAASNQNPFNSTPATPESAANTAATIDDAANRALLAGATSAQQGGNANQVQGATQSGAFQTTGQQNQTQAETQTQQSNQNQTGTSQVIDTLGFGDLLKQAQAGAAGADASRTGFLQGVLETGDPALQKQTDMAVRQSLSGPGMQGTGDSARARAAGYAAEGVARNSMGAQLNAAQQLAGPTAVSSLSTAAQPFLGNQTSQNTNATNLTNSLAQLINNESQTGTSGAKSTQIAAGNQPIQQSSGGGSIICTVLVEHGFLPWDTVNNEVKFISANWSKFRRAAIGYFFYGTPVAKAALRHKWVALLTWPVAWACSYEANRRGYKNRKFNPFAWVGYHAFFSLCDKLGWFLLRTRPEKALPQVVDSELVLLLKKHKLEM